jgi:TolA-binding protein
MNQVNNSTRGELYAVPDSTSRCSQCSSSQIDRFVQNLHKAIGQVTNSTPNSEADRLLDETELRIQQTKTELSQMESTIKRHRHCIRSNQTETTRRINNVHSE